MTISGAKRRLLMALRREVSDERVLAAMADVPRERFMPPDLVDRAYDNEAFPIGFEQTISQPVMVATMLAALEVTPGDRVLDVGTGSGYQAALLSRMGAKVMSVEIIPALADGARSLLEDLGCADAEVRLAGSDLGWPAEAPYDAVAAAPSVLSSLIDQLSASGRLVIPVGPPFEQRLAIIHRRGDGVDVAWGSACRFVPLMGVDGWTGPRDPADGSLPAFDAPVDDE